MAFQFNLFINYEQLKLNYFHISRYTIHLFVQSCISKILAQVFMLQRYNVL